VKRIGILTSGGDAPGMNAAVRAAVRTALHLGATPFAIDEGYVGMIAGEGHEMTSRDVSNIIQRGGTVIHTGRSPEFFTPEGRAQAVSNLEGWRLEGLVLIGGDGSFRGALELLKVWGGRIVGVPGTIDNDLWGTDLTIGFDTAVNTALESIDKIRDTADAHKRTFIVEVMGRHAGFIALAVGIAGGAEVICIPERPTDVQAIAHDLAEHRAAGKRSIIMVVAEGDEAGSATEIGEKLRRIAGIESRVTVLGHVQRGGSPTATDRILATKLAAFAVESLLGGATGLMAGERNGRCVLVPFEDAVTRRKPVDAYLLKLADVLAS